MAYKFDPENPLFRELSDEEEAEFTLHALLNPPSNLENWGLFHPVCRAEWIRQGIQPEKKG